MQQSSAPATKKRGIVPISYWAEGSFPDYVRARALSNYSGTRTIFPTWPKSVGGPVLNVWSLPDLRTIPGRWCLEDSTARKQLEVELGTSCCSLGVCIQLLWSVQSSPVQSRFTETRFFLLLSGCAQDWETRNQPWMHYWVCVSDILLIIWHCSSDLKIKINLYLCCKL